MSVAYKQLVSEDRRLVILRFLAESNGYDANSSIVQSVLNQFGHRPSRDLVHTELDWLQEQGLVTNSKVTSVVVSKLTQRGLDVATGNAIVSGVKPPSPDDQ